MLERAARWAELKQWERRELGQELRRLGLSYREIREIIPAPKGTLSGWCRDIVLTPDQQARLRALNHPQFVRRRVGARHRRRNLDRIEAIRAVARAEAELLAPDPFWLAGVVAYWAEGSKGNSLQFANSDPAFIVLFMQWSVRFLGVTPDEFTISLHLHDGQDEDERKRYWSEITGLPLDSFRKTFVKPEGTGHRKNILYNGTARIRVSRSGDRLHRVSGWIEWLKERHATFR